jgi:hypothetical protein
VGRKVAFLDLALTLNQDYKWKDDKYRIAASECRERIAKLLRDHGAVEYPEQPDETA